MLGGEEDLVVVIVGESDFITLFVEVGEVEALRAGFEQLRHCATEGL